MISKRKIKIAVGLFVFGIISKLILSVCRDSVIIQFGIQKYRITSNVFTVWSVVTFLLLICCIVVYRKKIKAEKQSPVPEAPAPTLSVSSDLDPNKMYQILSDYALRAELPGEQILQIAMQLKTMDIYQEKLENLLRNNGAESLDDAKDILDEVEQSLCKAIRKVINYIEVSDGNSKEDLTLLSRELDSCQKTCENLLEQVKDFLFALADFLNRQGEDKSVSEIMETYRQCILRTIESK